MKFPATWLLLFFSPSYIVTSTYFPAPILKSTPPPTNMSTAQKLVFFEEANVTLTCSLPMDPIPDDIELRIGIGKYERNPVHPDEYFKFTIHPDMPQLDIKYNHEIFIPYINVSCLAVNRTSGQTKNSSLIGIEQEYQTMNVIHSGKELHQVEAGETVRLECLADGNPKPKYQWYKRMEDGHETKMENGTQRITEFATMAHKSTKGFYVCGANNKYNTQAVKADPILVISEYNPAPVFKSTPPPTNMSTAQKLVFFEEANVTMTCSLPMDPTPDDIELQIVTGIYERNPVHPDEYLNFTNHQDKPQLDLKYNHEIFIPFFNVSCLAVNRTSGQTKYSAHIVIEQQYQTMNVIHSGMTLRQIDAGETARLECLADGNPKPEYQWYNRSLEGNETKMENGNQRILEFVTPTNWSTESYYVCGAKNKYNTQFVKADLIIVVSALIPPPQILPTPTPTNDSTATKFVFFEDQKVNVTCSLPMTVPVPDYMQQWMNYSQVQLNPVSPQETAHITEDYKFPEMTLNIEYKPNVFVSLIEVTCQSLHLLKRTIKTVTIQIEQQYKTMNVIIMGNTTVEPGEKVNLTCVADGNPEPKLYQWYNKTGSGNEELKGATQPTLQLTIPEKWSSLGEYICGAKNSYNKDFSLSQPISVAAILPTPTPSRGNVVAYSSSWDLLVATTLIILLRDARSC